MLSTGVDNSSSMGFPSSGRLLRSLGLSDLTKKPVGVPGSAPSPGKAPWATHRGTGRLSLRPPTPHRQRPGTPAAQARVRHGSQRLCLRSERKWTLATCTVGYVSRQTSCASHFLGPPKCRHGNPGPWASAAINGDCLRRCLQRRETTEKNPNSLSGSGCVLKVSSNME